MLVYLLELSGKGVKFLFVCSLSLLQGGESQMSPEEHLITFYDGAACSLVYVLRALSKFKRFFAMKVAGKEIM